MILDTTALIDLLRGDSKVTATIKDLEERNVPLMTTTITVFELWQGAYDIGDERKRERIIALLESVNILVFDVRAAEEAGSIHRLLRTEGAVIDPEDSMIAGIARSNHESVLTRNRKHFERIERLKVETY